MKYSISINEICGILGLKERTAFRRIEHAYANLADNLNKSKYSEKLRKIMDEETWITDVRDEVKERRMAFKNRSFSV